MSRIRSYLEYREQWVTPRLPLPWALRQMKGSRLSGVICYSDYAYELFFRALRRFPTVDGATANSLIYKCIRRSGSKSVGATYNSMYHRFHSSEDIVGWTIEDIHRCPLPITKGLADSMEKELYPWDDEGWGEDECYLSEEHWMEPDGPYCVNPQIAKDKYFTDDCPICGTKMSHVQTPKGYKWRKTNIQFNYPHVSKHGDWYYKLCNNEGCQALAYPFRHKRWRDHNTVFVKIFKEIITYDLTHNPHIRRAAEDFIRHARPIFEARSNSTGRESHCEIVGQHIEISRD